MEPTNSLHYFFIYEIIIMIYYSLMVNIIQIKYVKYVIIYYQYMAESPITGTITGIDDIANWLDNMANDLEPKQLTSWASKIQNKANEYYGNSHKCPIKFEISCDAKPVIICNDDIESKSCIIRAIKYYRNSVTIGVQKLSDSIIKSLNTK